jgi:hypothetical protein
MRFFRRLHARFKRFCFLTRKLFTNEPWQAETHWIKFYADRSSILTYLGAVYVPKGAQWPDDPSIKRIAFYDEVPDL